MQQFSVYTWFCSITSVEFLSPRGSNFVKSEIRSFRVQRAVYAGQNRGEKEGRGEENTRRRSSRHEGLIMSRKKKKEATKEQPRGTIAVLC